MYGAEDNMNFDTHKHIKAFISAGIEEKQAEAIVSVIQNSREYDTSKLITKDQLELVRISLSNEIRILSQKVENLHSKFNDLELIQDDRLKAL